MKKNIHISATLDQPDLLANMVEKLAYRYNDRFPGSSRLPESFISSSPEPFISGTINLSNNKEDFHIPFITRFIFTCVRSGDAPFRLAWASSLS